MNKIRQTTLLQREIERACIEAAIKQGIEQGLFKELPNGNLALTEKGQLVAQAQRESRGSTKQ